MFVQPRNTDPAVLHTLHNAALSVRPDLAGTPARWIATGWDNDVLILNREWVFRWPLNDAAADRLLNEPVALNLARTRLTLAVPAMTLHRRPMLFSEHRLIPGSTMDGARYSALPAAAKATLADDLAAAYAELHAIHPHQARGARARSVTAWPAAYTVERAVLDRLRGADADPNAEGAVRRIVAAYSASCPADDKTVFGQFDAHGWNMAFDTERNRLAGLFDFAASGLGPLHRDLCYPAFVDDGLMRAVITAYNAKTGRGACPSRAKAAFAMLRCIEFLGASGPLDHFIAAIIDAAPGVPPVSQA